MTNNNFQTLPALPLKNTILFPGLLLPLSVGRESSLKAVQGALKTEEKEIILIAQREPHVDNPEQDDLYTIGTKAVIRKSSRVNDGVMEILVLGVERVVVVKLDNSEGYLTRNTACWHCPKMAARKWRRCRALYWSWRRKRSPWRSRKPLLK